MTDILLHDLIRESLRVGLLLGGPVLLAALVAGLIAGLFQGTTLIADPAVGYAVRALAIFAAVAVLATTAQQLLGNLLRMALT